MSRFIAACVAYQTISKRAIGGLPDFPYNCPSSQCGTSINVHRLWLVGATAVLILTFGVPEKALHLGAVLQVYFYYCPKILLQETHEDIPQCSATAHDQDVRVSRLLIANPSHPEVFAGSHALALLLYLLAW